MGRGTDKTRIDSVNPKERDISLKVDHVLKARGYGNHTCHWPGCFAKVKPAFWGCTSHWFKLPRELRAMVWASYVPGQETTKRPSARYLQVAEMIQVWIIATEVWATIRPMVCSGNLENLGVSHHPLQPASE